MDSAKLKGICKNCSYFKTTFCGSYLMNITEKIKKFYFPALNKERNQIIAGNIYLREKETKKGILFYDSELLINKESKTDKIIFSCNYGTIYDAEYFCPSCKKHSLYFTHQIYIYNRTQRDSYLK